MKNKLPWFLSMLSCCILYSNTYCQNVVWGDYNSRTEYRDNAGLTGSEGALSGFFQTYQPTNYPQGANSWWHLLDVRHSNPGNNYAMQFAGSFWDQNLYFRKTINNPSQSWSRVLLETNGNVGIGTSAPSSWGKLTVAGNLVFANDATDYMISGPANGGAIRIKSNMGTEDRYIQLGQVDNNQVFYAYLTAANNGNIGIGTTDTKGYKLAVNGSAVFTKAVVKLNANWPDYVFHKNYKLPTLEEIEKYIKLHQHLPDVPSAKEVEKNGIDLGDNQALLLKKIEELTLIIINLNKKVVTQQKNIIELKQMFKKDR